MRKIVGILGPSYCGSTLLNYVLGVPPGTVAVGEAHWIIDHDGAGREQVLCLDHGAECPAFTPEILERFRHATPDWYARLAEAINAEVLVVADKVSCHHVRCGMPDVGVVAFKDPRAHVASLQHHGGGDDWAAHVRTISWYYQDILAMVCPKIVVSIEDFVARPVRLLQRFSEVIGVDIDGRALRFWESGRQHNLGGNFTLRHHFATRERPGYNSDWAQRFQRKFSVDDRWRTELTPEVAQAIIDDPEIKAVYGELMRLKEGP